MNIEHLLFYLLIGLAVAYLLVGYLLADYLLKQRAAPRGLSRWLGLLIGFVIGFLAGAGGFGAGALLVVIIGGDH